MKLPKKMKLLKTKNSRQSLYINYAACVCCVRRGFLRKNNNKKKKLSEARTFHLVCRENYWQPQQSWPANSILFDPPLWPQQRARAI